MDWDMAYPESLQLHLSLALKTLTYDQWRCLVATVHPDTPGAGS